jgi:hypothetical protein
LTTVTTDADAPAPIRPAVMRALGVVAFVAVGLYALASVVFLVLGRLNADEGWYLYGARLVSQGKLPFRDFSFTQMPLLPYLYGLPQLVKPSFYLGRAVSAALATAGVALCVRVAWREAGRTAAAATAVLCLAVPIAIYNLTLVKTYALAAFFLAAILATLTSPGRRTITLPLATAAAVGLTFSRTSGAPLTVIVVVYVFLRAHDTMTRVRISVIAGLGVLLAAFFALGDVEATRFDLSSFHQLLWHGADTSTKMDTVLTQRIPDWFGDYWGYVLLAVAAIVATLTSRPLRQYVRRQPGYLIVSVGVLLFLALQLPAGQFASVEYAAPVVPVVITIPVILLSRRLLGAIGTAPSFRGAAVVGTAAVAGVALLTIVHPSARDFLVDRGSPASVGAANRVGEYLREQTRADDEVLALWGQPATLTSGRDLVPDVTFGLFSYEDLSTRRARALHYVNHERLIQVIESGRPAAIVLTDVDRTFLNFRGSLSTRRADASEVLAALDGRYHKVRSDVGLGVYVPSTIDIYLRDDRP